MSFGLVYLGLGILALASPLAPSLLPAFGLGVILLLVGIIGLIHVFLARHWDGLAVQLLVGVVASVTGCFLVTGMMSETRGLAQILEAYFLIVGLFRLLFALIHRRLLHRGALVLSGWVGLILGLLIPWTRSEGWLMSAFLAVDLLVYGLTLVSAGRARWVKPGLAQPRPRPAAVEMRSRNRDSKSRPNKRRKA